MIVVGSGAREHAFARAFTQEGVDVVVAPGNAGTAMIGRNAKVRADDVPGLVALAEAEKPRLVFVGPEVPLSLGLVDALGARGIPAFGPTQAAARMESSKGFMKRFLGRHGIPTAGFEVFDDSASAKAYVKKAARPLVVKADGLAAGKGVVVAGTTEEALLAVNQMMTEGVFGAAGRTVVIEELLPGEEVSFHVVADGTRFHALPPAQDHKRVGDGDKGPNTGGMGAYAPAPIVSRALHDAIVSRIIEPTLAGFAREGMPFRGVLFAGLMIRDGEPTVLEFNVRFGDPEASVLVPLYGGSWLDLLVGAAGGALLPAVNVTKASALSVVMASEGYPATPTTGDAIAGLDLPELPGSFVLHAGTSRSTEGAVVTAGGRVLTVGAVGPTLDAAATRAYEATARIQFRGEHHRTDIGAKALKLARPLPEVP